MNLILEKADTDTTLQELESRLQQAEEAGDLFRGLRVVEVEGENVNLATFEEDAADHVFGDLFLTLAPDGTTLQQDEELLARLTGDGSTFVDFFYPAIEGAVTRVCVCHKPGEPHPSIAAADDQHGTSNVDLKPEVIKKYSSPHHSSRNGVAIGFIVVHCTELSRENTLRTFLDPSAGHGQKSVHYVVDTNGDIYQLVDDHLTANHCKGANKNTIGIEHVGMIGDVLAPKQRAASVALIRYLLEQYEIAPEKVFGHDFMPGRKTDTSCPDKLFGPVHNQKTVSDWVQANVVAKP